jgi:hypothetical protein
MISFLSSATIFQANISLIDPSVFVPGCRLSDMRLRIARR